MMDIRQLQKAIERTHQGTAAFVESVPVREEFQGETVWEGPVHVFDLAGKSTAIRAYAFVIENNTGKRIAAVLHQAPEDSPQAAVRAAIVAGHRSKMKG
jgi:hypothetical protein